MARILVFTPTYANLLQAETCECIHALQFNGELFRMISDDNPYPGRDMRNVQYQYDKARWIALKDNYDAVLLIEHDMIVPIDTAQKLHNTPAKVVYGTYQLRHGMHALNLFQWCSPTNLGMSLSLYPGELRQARKAKSWKVSGAGFGCLYIHREVLQQIPFRDTGNAPDLPFAVDCVRAGIEQIGRLDVACGHIDTDNHCTLWPYEEACGMIARVLAKQTIAINDRGQSMAIVKDRYYSISVETARELERAGYVEITNSADTEAELAERETATDVVAEARETTTKPATRRRKRTPKKASSAKS